MKTYDTRVGDQFVRRNLVNSNVTTVYVYTAVSVEPNYIELRYDQGNHAYVTSKQLEDDYVCIHEAEDTPDVDEPGNIGTILRFEATVGTKSASMYGLANQNTNRTVYIERIAGNRLQENWQDLKTECVYTWLDILTTSVPGSIQELTPSNGTIWDEESVNSDDFDAEKFIKDISEKARKHMDELIQKGNSIQSFVDKYGDDIKEFAKRYLTKL